MHYSQTAAGTVDSSCLDTLVILSWPHFIVSSWPAVIMPGSTCNSLSEPSAASCRLMASTACTSDPPAPACSEPAAGTGGNQNKCYSIPTGSKARQGRPGAHNTGATLQARLLQALRWPKQSWPPELTLKPSSAPPYNAAGVYPPTWHVLLAPPAWAAAGAHSGLARDSKLIIRLPPLIITKHLIGLSNGLRRGDMLHP